MPIRLLIYDRTCGGAHGLPGLSTAWRTGAAIYRGAGRIDAAFGVSSWDEAATRVEEASPGEEIEQVQYWGHGRFGRILVDAESLDARALDPVAPARFVALLRERFVRDDRALFWMRTCEAFGGAVGQSFARRLADFLDVKVAGHTYIIGFWQSGLHSLLPGATPTWSPIEGVAKGTAEQPEQGAWSSPLAPNTIHCLEGKLPSMW